MQKWTFPIEYCCVYIPIWQLFLTRQKIISDVDELTFRLWPIDFTRWWTDTLAKRPAFAISYGQRPVPQRVNRHKWCLFRRRMKDVVFITEARKIILFTNTTLSRFGFGGTVYRTFLFRPKQWNGGHVGVPKQSCGSSTLFLCKHIRWVYVT